jgi:hypothetical protein
MVYSVNSDGTVSSVKSLYPITRLNTNDPDNIRIQCKYITDSSNLKEEGKKEAYDEFWDSLQQNGERMDYWGAFCGWAEDAFNPKYIPLVVGSGNWMFRGSKIKTVPKISLISASLNEMFYEARSLETIEEIELPYSAGSASNAFTNCIALKNVTFVGPKAVTGSISFQSCTLLTKESITSIVNILSATASGKTLTLSKVAVDKAFETSEGANDGSTSTEWATLVATKTNWTISLAQ